jgi:hypothetical protein
MRHRPYATHARVDAKEEAGNQALGDHLGTSLGALISPPNHLKAGAPLLPSSLDLSADLIDNSSADFQVDRHLNDWIDTGSGSARALHGTKSPVPPQAPAVSQIGDRSDALEPAQRAADARPFRGRGVAKRPVIDEFSGHLGRHGFSCFDKQLAKCLLDASRSPAHRSISQ